MRPDRVRILNFDDSLTAQARYLDGFNPVTVDLASAGPAARLWAGSAQVAAIRRRLDPAQKDWITLLGSGDYHHVTALLLGQFAGPLTVVSFDHHPDWDTLPPRGGCGAWVSRALELPGVAQVLLVGIASSDLAFPAVLTGNRRALRDGRVVALPYEAPRRAGPFAGLWRNELKADPVGIFAEAVGRLPVRRVYVTIDKDCLTAAHALTNWEEGRVGLEILLEWLRLLGRTCEIAGLDITGEHSAGRPAGRWKAWCSRIDHPARPSAWGRAPDEIARVNGTTNRRILETLRSLASPAGT